MRLHKNILSQSVSILFIGLMFIGIIHHSYETHHDYPTNQKHFCAWSLQSMAEPAPVVFIVKPKIQKRQVVFIKNKVNVIIREEEKHRFVRGPPEGAYSSAIFLIINNHTNNNKMKNIKYFGVITIIGFLVCSILSCSKDDVEPDAPVISRTEFGHDNNKTAYIGADLHVEVDISAPGKIHDIKVELHPQSGNGWEYSEVFTDDFEGLLNATFHKHIQIPEDAAPGEYHLHFIVTDNNGKQTSAEAHIEILSDPTLPSVSDYSVDVTDEGNTLNVEAHISAPNKIAVVEIEIHGSWEDEFEYKDADMVGQSSYHFSKEIDISDAPAGHYHVHLGITDQEGKHIEFEEHFDK